MDERPSVTFSLTFRAGCDILDFKTTVSFVGNDTFRLDAVVIQHIHRTFFEVAVNHVFLFICQQKQGKELLFIFANFSDFHSGYSIPRPTPCGTDRRRSVCDYLTRWQATK